jgi:hypothetical protein
MRDKSRRYDAGSALSTTKTKVYTAKLGVSAADA